MSEQGSLFRNRSDAGLALGVEPVDLSPRAEALHRADDQGGSIASAERVVDTGRAATESALVLHLLKRYPGSTSAELAHETDWDAHMVLGQEVEAWRTTCARRLPGLEDQGLVRAVVARPSVRRPNRDVDPNLAPCTVSPGAPQSIRWWPR